MARLTGLDPAGVIARHQAAEYTVGWMGFSPGFGYLTGLDSALHGVQRLARPRLSVPAGSVAIAGGLACVYPATSPGGWRLLGRTSTRIWDPGASRPRCWSRARGCAFARSPTWTPYPARLIQDNGAISVHTAENRHGSRRPRPGRGR